MNEEEAIPVRSPQTAMILVHPGSMYGSAEFTWGKYEARSQRDGVLSVIKNHKGPFIVIDGALSDKIYNRDNELIMECLEKAKLAGLPALRLWGDDAGEKPYDEWQGMGDHPLVHEGQEAAAQSLIDVLKVFNKVDTIGCWASHDLYGEGCVNSVAAVLHDNLPDVKVLINEYSIFVPEDEDEDEE